MDIQFGNVIIRKISGPLRSILTFYLIGIVGLFIVGRRSEFVYDPELAGSISGGVDMLGLVGGVLFLLILLLAPYKALQKYGRFIRLLVGVIAIPVIWMFTSYAWFKGAPHLIAKINDQNDGSYVYVVKQKYISYENGECRGGIRVNDLPINVDEICNIPRDVWLELIEGSSIEVIGNTIRQGVFPLTYKVVQ